MDDDKLPWWANALKYMLERWGFPTVVAIVLGLAAWNVATWFGEKADTALNAHVKFLEKTNEVSVQQTDLTREQVTLTRELQQINKAMADKVDDIHRKVVAPK